MFEDRVCPVCGKKFLKPVESIYKLKFRNELKHLCSYTCYVNELKRRGKW